ncbi:MAG: thioredoxin family protein [Ignavibacteriaceae bacterium]
MKYLVIILTFFVSVVTFAQEREKFDPNRDAAKDIENAVVEAKKTGKRILLDVGGEWCSWCHLLDKFYINNKDINDFMHKNYVVVKVNFSPENENKEVLSKYPQIPGYPHYFVLDKDGKLLHSQGTGELEKGRGYDKDSVMKFLKKWAPKG